MPTDLQHLERHLKALASTRRLRILSYLRTYNEATVGDIARAMQMTPYAISQHLRILRSAEIVRFTKRGKYVFYRILQKQQPHVREVLRRL